MGGDLPLPVLLSRALAGLAREFAGAVGDGRGGDGASEAAPALPPSLPLWANVLRVIDGNGNGDGSGGAEGSGAVAVRELPVRARLSKRAMKASVDSLVRLGWAEVDDARAVRLVGAGAAARRDWEPLVAAAEARVVDAAGAATVAALRSCLEELVATLDLELPHYPTPYGTADPSITGLFPRRAEPGPPALPPRGNDWSVVVRDRSADTVSQLPLHALLSQALVAFTIDYEAECGWSLATVVHVLRHVPDDGLPLAELPVDWGITGKGKSLLERWDVAEVGYDPIRPKVKVVRLTGRGKAQRDWYEPLTASIERRWRDRFGPAVIDGVRGPLAEVAAALPPGLPDHPLVRWTGAAFDDQIR